MDKVLTISIAAYNVENYIRQALDSLIDKRIIDDLEIFVVDDGGTDQTLTIAQEYADRYPRTVFPVHKENGGYGSTVNYSIEHATGKYFKLLDGDDWYETEGILQLVEQLKQIETDVVSTPYFTCIYDGTKEKRGEAVEYTQDQDLLISELRGNIRLGMWRITYRTEILRASKVTFPLHCFYTDQIYSTVPFGTAKTIRFIECPVYCYRIGQDGQTVTREARRKYIGDNQKVCEILYQFYEKEKALQNENIQYLLNRITVYAQFIIKTYLLEPVSMEVLSEIAAYDRHLKDVSSDIYHRAVKVSYYKKTALLIRGIRMLRYGKAANAMLKMILPREGIKNWT